jgi:DNA invertase Pin-like site-specific DNA recombinase
MEVRDMKVCLYLRVSTKDQDCHRQERDLLEFATRRGDEVIGIYKEVASGTKNDRLERKKVIDLARSRRIDAVLVTEMTRWGRSTVDLIQTLQEMEAYGVSLIAQSGLQFDLTTPQGRLMASLLAAISQFERELTVERVRSGLAAARARGIKLGRQEGFRPKGDKYEAQVLEMIAEGKSYRTIASELCISKNTVMGIVRRSRKT